MTDTELEQRLRDLRQADMPLSGTAGRPGSTAAAWREFQALRSRSVTMRQAVRSLSRLPRRWRAW